MKTIIMLTLVFRTAEGPRPHDLAITRDMPTCEALAEMLNADKDPSAVAICRRMRPPTDA